jgi:hypothetical protein
MLGQYAHLIQAGQDRVRGEERRKALPSHGVLGRLLRPGRSNGPMAGKVWNVAPPTPRPKGARPARPRATGHRGRTSRTLPVLDDVGVGALARVSEDDAQLFADAPSWTVICFQGSLGWDCRAAGAPRVIGDQ